MKKFPVYTSSSSADLSNAIQSSLSLDMVKKHLRVQHNEDNEYILMLLNNAYSIAQQYTGASFISGIKYFDTDVLATYIKIFDEEATSVISISYTDTSGSIHFMDLDLVGVETKIGLDGQYLLITLNEVPEIESTAGSVRVNYKAGKLDSNEKLPGAVVQALLLIIGEYYEYREDRAWELTKASERLLNPFKSY